MWNPGLAKSCRLGKWLLWDTAVSGKMAQVGSVMCLHGNVSLGVQIWRVLYNIHKDQGKLWSKIEWEKNRESDYKLQKKHQSFSVSYYNSQNTACLCIQIPHSCNQDCNGNGNNRTWIHGNKGVCIILCGPQKLQFGYNYDSNERTLTKQMKYFVSNLFQRKLLWLQSSSIALAIGFQNSLFKT